MDENIIFDNAIPEWKDFCKNPLGFEIPVYEPVEVRALAGKDDIEF